jgi:hypothetical protein
MARPGLTPIESITFRQGLQVFDGPVTRVVAQTREQLPGGGHRRDGTTGGAIVNGGTRVLVMTGGPVTSAPVTCFSRRAATDYAQVLKDLSDTHFPDARKIVRVQDNLSTHTPASLYQAFPPTEARRLVERFEWHYTPKHGGWLDLAESELGVLSSQCLDRRIPDKPTLTREVHAWVQSRNVRHATADWRFTTETARVKLKHLYPSI